MFYKKQLQTKLKSILGLNEGMVDNVETEVEKQCGEFRDKTKFKELVESMKKNQQPHKLGTVAEIAQKYGISKSEVRRRKADGTLIKFLEQLRLGQPN